jgi:V/A-type H+-transporting ATPase subunit A
VSFVQGRITGVNGNMVEVEVPPGAYVIQNEVAYVSLGDIKLKSEVIKIRDKKAYIQVFEDTKGVKVDQNVEFTGEMLSATLGPGLLGMIYDGLQNPLRLLKNKQDFFLQRGQYIYALNEERAWEFNPSVKVGDTVKAGTWLGWVKENHYKHQIMTPFGFLGSAVVAEIVSKGNYRIKDKIASLKMDDGRIVDVKMFQNWPVKKAIAAYPERIYPQEPLVTQCRIIDTMFPVARGGVACVPGPFGAGKTVLQHLISRFAQVDIVVVVACGERAGEVVEIIHEFPELEDPKTGGTLMDRTIIICNTSSMPVAARDASIYTGITLGEYYRQMGLDVLVLADSTSRWAQAMREMSGRLEEIPGEEAFPAYLESRIASVYERAGLVRLHNNKVGAVSMIGAVSPAGGNFEEPVTQATLKVVGAFLGLSRKRSDERRFPAIDPIDSWSRYLTNLESGLNKNLDEKWVEMVRRGARFIREGAEVGRMMTVVGEEGISIEDLIVYLKGELFDATYLQQNAFDNVDAATSMTRQIRDFKLINKALEKEFKFETKQEARAFFTNLQDAFYQKNFCKEESAESTNYEDNINKLIEEGSLD